MTLSPCSGDGGFGSVCLDGVGGVTAGCECGDYSLCRGLSGAVVVTDSANTRHVIGYDRVSGVTSVRGCATSVYRSGGSGCRGVRGSNLGEVNWLFDYGREVLCRYDRGSWQYGLWDASGVICGLCGEPGACVSGTGEWMRATLGGGICKFKARKPSLRISRFLSEYEKVGTDSYSMLWSLDGDVLRSRLEFICENDVL